MTQKVIALEIPPGIQRDGTRFDAPCFTDGKWMRFQRNRPRKIGGYDAVFLNATGLSRGMAMTAVNGFNYVVSGYNTGLQQWVTGSSGGVGSGPYTYNLNNFTVSNDNLWQFDIAYDSTGNNTNNLVAHPGQNLSYITSTVNTPVLYGTFPGGFGSLSGVTITGTSGTFSCVLSGITLTVNQQMTISGTFGGTGSITGYTDPTTYYITATNGSTTFTLSTSFGGAPITTTAGTPTGLTFTAAASMSKVGLFTATANTTNGDTSVTLTAANVRVGAGQTVTGTGVSGTVSSITGNTITLSAAATASTTAPLSGVYLTGTAGQFACTATTGLAIGQTINISGSTTSTSLGSAYATNTSGRFVYTNGTALSVGTAVSVSGTTSNTQLSTVYATGTAGAFSCVAAGTTLAVGQQVVVSGTATDSTLSSVYGSDTAGNFTCVNATFLQVGQIVSVSGTPAATALFNVYSTGLAGTFSCGGSAALTVGQTITVSGAATATALSGVYSTGAAGTLVCTASATTLQVGQTVTVTGATSTSSLTSVVITGAAGTFQCASSPVTLYIGQPVVISGAFGGTGSITGYTDPKTYYIIATNGTTTFTLSATLGGAAVTTVAGTPTGVAYTLSAATGYSAATYYIVDTNGFTTLTLSATSGGAPLTTTVGATTGLAFSANALTISGYSTPTTYYITATNGASTFTLSTTSGGAAVTTTIGPATGLSFNSNALSIAGYIDPTNYYIRATNGTTTFQLSATSGGAAVTTTAGPNGGLVFTAKASNIPAATYFIIATNGSTTFTLSTTPTGSGVTVTLGSTIGLTITAQAATITGYVNPTVYYVIATDGASYFQLSATSGGAAITNTIGPATGLSFLIRAPSVLSGVAITGIAGQFSCSAAPVTLLVNQPVVISGVFGGTGSITGYLGSATYYIITTNGSTTFTLSATLGGTAITTTAGTPTGLSYVLSGAAIAGYPGTPSYYIIATNGTSTFQISATSGGTAVVTAIGTTTNLTFSVSNPVTLTFDNNIAVSGGCVVLHPYLFIYGNNGLIQNSSAGDFSNWVSPDANTNNVATGKIVKGLPIRGGSTSPSGLFWAADALIRVSFQPSSAGGVNYFWAYDLVSSQTSIMSSSSVIEYDGIYYWCGVDRFLMYGGQVQEVTNNLNQNYFFDNVNMAQRQKVWATKVPRYGEIWWFYPKGDATECTDAIIYNVREKSWYDAGEALGARRSAGVFSEVFPKPVWAGNESNSAGQYTLWQHETGYDTVNLTTVTAIESFFETNSIGTMGGLVGSQRQPGDNLWTRLERIEPDFVQTGTMSVIVTGEGYADDTTVDSDPYLFTSSTLKIDMREQRREMRLRFTSNEAGGTYQTGRILLSMSTGDTRGTGNP